MPVACFPAVGDSHGTQAAASKSRRQVPFSILRRSWLEAPQNAFDPDLTQTGIFSEMNCTPKSGHRKMTHNDNGAALAGGLLLHKIRICDRIAAGSLRNWNLSNNKSQRSEQNGIDRLCEILG